MWNTRLAFVWLPALLIACGDAPAPPQDDAPAPAGEAAATAPPLAVAKEAAVRRQQAGVRPANLLQMLRVPEGDPIAVALALPDPFERMESLAHLLPTLGPDSVPTVKALLEGLNQGTQDFGAGEYTLLVEFWVRQNAEEAARWVLFQSPRAYRSLVVRPVVVAWARQDPETVAGVVDQFVALPGLYTELAQVGLIWGWVDSGKPGLDAHIQARGEGFERQRMLEAAAERKVETEGPDATIRWAESLPDDERAFKLAAFRQTARAIARAAPEAAVAWCKKQCDGPYGENMRSIIAQHWAWRDGPAAMAWVAAMPPGQERDWAVKGAFRGWWPMDREGLIAWAAQLERDGIPDWFQPAIAIYTSGLARKAEPSDAARWASYIEDEGQRTIAFENVGRLWLRRDPAAAEAWLATAPITEESKEHIRHPVPGRGPRVFPAPDES